jgi:RimJ/RimL family protein N-acetyltransferase
MVPGGDLMQNAFLIGERIYLRAVTEEDLANYFSWLNDQETTRWMQRGIYPNTMEDMKSYYSSMQQGGNMLLAIMSTEEIPYICPDDAETAQLKHFSEEEICRIYHIPLHLVRWADSIKTRLCHKHIGNISLSNLHPTFRTAEISIIIGEQVRGCGYGTEAIKLLASHAFTRMNLNRLQAGAVVKNIGCTRAFEKAGFQKEGILRQAYYCEGEYQDVQIMSIVKDDWRRGQ